MVLKIKIAGLTIYKILNHLSMSVLAASVDTSLAQLKKVQTKINTKYMDRNLSYSIHPWLLVTLCPLCPLIVSAQPLIAD